MLGVNRVILIGYVGSDPSLMCGRQSEHVCTFSVATKATAPNSGGKPETVWHKVVVCEQLAISCKESLLKGSLVYIEGSLHPKAHREGRKIRYAPEIQARRVDILEKNAIGETSKIGSYPKTSPKVGGERSKRVTLPIPYDVARLFLDAAKNAALSKQAVFIKALREFVSSYRVGTPFISVCRGPKLWRMAFFLDSEAEMVLLKIARQGNVSLRAACYTALIRFFKQRGVLSSGGSPL